MEWPKPILAPFFLWEPVNFLKFSPDPKYMFKIILLVWTLVRKVLCSHFEFFMVFGNFSRSFESFKIYGKILHQIRVKFLIKFFIQKVLKNTCFSGPIPILRVLKYKTMKYDFLSEENILKFEFDFTKISLSTQSCLKSYSWITPDSGAHKTCTGDHV